MRSGTRRRYHDDGISDDEIEGRRTFDLEEKLRSERFTSDRVKRMEGKDLTFEYIQRGGLRDPIIFEKPDGLGIKMPDPDFSVNDVKIFVGSRRMIDVMDVSTQKGIEMSMAQWRRYYETPPSQRDKLYNVISLEFSHTKLENLVQRPTSVDIIDWVDNMWPRHLKERQRDSTNSITDMQYPKVQKYCLMSVQGCYTDFHIDFGGSSVWYHILRGGKVFWLIPPTPQNLELYEDWVLSGKQGDIFLGDKAQDCQRIELKQGYTFMIPSGWIHAVYTPVDTLVFGGNFLHSFNIPMQLNICSIEDRTRVPAKFRYPFYYEMCWYVLERYLFSLTNTSYLTPEFQKHSLGIGKHRDWNRRLRWQPWQWCELSLKKIKITLGFQSPPMSVELKLEPTTSESVNGHTRAEEEDDEEEAPLSRGPKVHLTPFELEGLWNLLGKLESLPSPKKCVPAGIHNAPALLHDMRVSALLKDHANDIPKLSYTGKPIVKWPKRLATTVVTPRPQKPASSMSVLRRRRVRCKRCEACVRTECGDCNFCRDMKKFGGPGKLKQTCVLRQCLAPGLPLSAVCEICGEGNQEAGEGPVFALTLMECSNCAEIAHPACLRVITHRDGVVNKDLPSCWECPKCVLGIVSSEVDTSPVYTHTHNCPLHCQSPSTLHHHYMPLTALSGRGEGSQQMKGGGFPPVLLVSDLNDDLLNGSYLTVTLQRPPRAKRLPGSIVPKLEAAMSPRAHGPGYVQRKTLGKTRHKNGAVAAGNGLAQPAKNPVGRPPRHRGSNPHGGTADRERETASSSSDSSASPAPPAHSSQSPSSLLSLPSFKDAGNEKVGEKEVWVAVFRYLSRAELAGCMTVCKAWYKWSCDKRLWSSVDVSRRPCLSTQALQGIIKRQPTSLDLSWTPVSKKQITLLTHRLPGLKELKMIGCSWCSLSALSTPSLPCLRSLDLRWAEGVKDSQIRDLITPPGSDSRSRLRGCTVLRLAGLDISDSTLRLILRHMPLLESLDLAHCKDLTDQSVCLLTSAGTHTRNTLTEIILAGCNKLTDTCLAYLKRAPSLELLDLRGCKAVTRRACEAFISDLSHCALFCMMEEKLIQRIS
uniref:[histone H3]-dimethyl-L-lysine(36) demethylase n=1 Tax=Esox lucius TaxID=8010 RepID=A0A6Q2YNP0_ESOLU